MPAEVVCSWCKGPIVLGLNERPTQSHGMCSRCAQQMNFELFVYGLSHTCSNLTDEKLDKMYRYYRSLINGYMKVFFSKETNPITALEGSSIIGVLRCCIRVVHSERTRRTGLKWADKVIKKGGN